MAELRTMYSEFYREEYIAAHGDTYGGMANKRSLLICGMERGMRNVPDEMAKFVANLCSDAMPELAFGDPFPILREPSTDWLEGKEPITERFRRSLS